MLYLLVISVPYRRARLFAFLEPERDPLGAGFQALQSLIAVGSGGLLGLGPGNSLQKLYFLPYPDSDFIFAIVAEELGMIGALAVVALFGVVLWRGLRAGWRAPDPFGRYLAWGFSSMLVMQALINISVAIALLADQGHSAAVPLLRRLVAGGHHDHLRRPAERLPTWLTRAHLDGAARGPPCAARRRRLGRARLSGARGRRRARAPRVERELRRFADRHGGAPRRGARARRSWRSPARPLVGRALWAKLAALADARPLGARGAARGFASGAFDVVIGTGGYASAPAVLGGRLARRPTRADRAERRGRASPTAGCRASPPPRPSPTRRPRAKLKCLTWVTGVPVRAAFFDIPPLRADGKPRLLVLGGSQGSLRINRLMPEVLAPLFDRIPELSVLHQCGETHLEETLAAYRAAGLETPRLRVVSFVDDVPAAMAAVDLVVSRAGAITLAEICAAGRPSVLLPLLAGRRPSVGERAAPRRGRGGEPDRGRRCSTPTACAVELASLLGDRARLAQDGRERPRLARPRRRGGDRRPDRGAAAAAREGRLMFHRFAGLRHAHFVGIGGAGMSGIAEVLLQYEVTVSGCDQSAERGDGAAAHARRGDRHRALRRTTSTASTCW